MRRTASWFLPLSAKQMAAGKIIAGGLWIAAYNGLIAVLLVLEQMESAIWDFAPH